MFYQQMLSRLSNAYNTRAAMQFTANVQADIEHVPGFPPQLYGNILLNKVTAALPGQDPNAGASGESRLAFTSPRLALQNSPSQPLAFLLTAPDTVRSETGSVIPSIRLDLSYDGTSIEHQIGPVPGIQGYHASTWLGFVIRDKDWPLQQPLGEFSVPLFLRAFPASPSVTGQDGNQTYPDAKDLSKVTRWSYAFTYSLPFHYPQDAVYGSVEFNIRSLLRAFAELEDAFAQLAQFVTVFPAVNKDLLEILAAIDAASQDRINDASVALQSFCSMVDGVIQAAGGPTARGLGLAMRSPAKNLAGDASLTYDFRIEEGFAMIGPERALRVSLIGEPPKGIGSPRVLIDPDHYDAIPYQDKTGDCDQPEHFCFVYKKKTTGKYLTDVEGQTIPARIVVLQDMDILQRQDAWSSVYLKRNEQLVPGRTSAEPFIYRTPIVQFANALYPLIDSDTLVSLAKLPPTAPKRSLLENLQALFQTLLANTETPAVAVQVEVNYEYSINAKIQSVSLPILMQTPLEVSLNNAPESAITLQQMIANWAQAIQLWFAANLPDGFEGVLWFDLTIMSNLTAKPMPLLRLRELYLPIGDIEPPLPVAPTLAGAGAAR